MGGSKDREGGDTKEAGEVTWGLRLCCSVPFFRFLPN